MDADENTDYSISYHLGSCQKNMGILKKFINASGPPQAAAGQYTAARRLRRRTGPAGGGPGFREGRPPGGGLGSQRWLVQCTPHFLFFCGTEKEKTGRARSKREKDAGHGTAWAEDRQDFCPRTGVHGGGRLRKGLSSWPRLRAAAAETYLRFAFQESRCLLKTAKRSVCRFYRRQTLLLFQMPSQRQRGQEVKSFPRPPKPPPAPIAWATPAGLPPKSPPRPRKPRRLFLFFFEKKKKKWGFQLHQSAQG